MRDHIGKAHLIDIITIGYRIGLGPRALAQITGYSERTLYGYAQELGLSFGPGKRSKLPNPIPSKFLIALLKAGVKIREPL